MRLESKKYLHDIREAIAAIEQFTLDKEFADYERDPMIRAAVERKFEIVGEAVARLAKLDETVASRIPEYRRIIAFRNILIHGYTEIDDHIVRGIVKTKLANLRLEVDALLSED